MMPDKKELIKQSYVGLLTEDQINTNFGSSQLASSNQNNEEKAF